MTRRKIAVVGSGVAGLSAAYLLQRGADVTLYEADERLGGHADTHDLPASDGRLLGIDTGFIVHNERTYPLLRRLFSELGVATQESEMSMSISCGGWSGAAWRSATTSTPLRRSTVVIATHPHHALGMLAAPGRLLLQQMSRRIDAAPGGGAFIESYIAPDMHMRPLSQTIGLLEQAGLEVRDIEAMREHYVATARHWIDTLEAKYPQFVALVGEQVARVWRLYLVGGALSFEQGRMGVDQVLAVRPGLGGTSAMPPTRPWTADNFRA